MVVKAGYLWIGRFRGAPIRLHWSIPVSAVLLTGFRFAPGAWLGCLLLILFHEMGHALAVVRSRLRVVSVDVLGIGGLCRWDGHPTPRQRVLIAWGGVLAQAVVGALTLIALAIFGRPEHAFLADVVYAFTQANLWLMAINLLPIPPLDGVEAWGILGLIGAARARRRMDAAQALAVQRRAEERAALPEKLHALDELDARDLPPLPEEVKRVLDRVMAEGRAAHESEKKK
jgi:Zn-dependent protease